MKTQTFSTPATACIAVVIALLSSSCQEAIVIDQVISDYQEVKEQEKEATPRKVEDGTYTKENEGSQTSTRYTVKDGKMEGLAQQFYKSGKLWKESHYKAGILHGEAKVYDEEGQLQRTVHYSEGKKHGRYVKYFKSGNIRSEVEYSYDLPLPGSRERGYRGELLEQPKIVVREEDRLTSDGTYYFHFGLEGAKAAEIYVLKDPEAWRGDNTELEEYRLLLAENGEGSIPLSLQQGFRFTSDLYIYATYKSKSGLDAVVMRQYEADVLHY